MCMLDRKLRGFGYALKGLRIASREESNFRVQIILGSLAILAGIFLHITRIEWLFVIGAAGLVLTAELLNTALEELCDMLKPTHDPHVAKIKDLSAGAVFAASVTALLIGCIIFLPYIFTL